MVLGLQFHVTETRVTRITVGYRVQALICLITYALGLEWHRLIYKLSFLSEFLYCDLRI